MRNMLSAAVVLVASCLVTLPAMAVISVEHEVIALEGDPAPGGPAGAFIDTLNPTVPGGTPFHNALGEPAFFAGLEVGPGGVTLGDRVVFYGPASGTLQPLLRQGTTPPGAPAGAILRSQAYEADLNVLGEAVVEWPLETGFGGVTSATDSALWRSDGLGGISLVAREGDPIPGGTNPFTSFATPWMCDIGRIVFHASGTSGAHGIFVSDRGGFFGALIKAGATLADPFGVKVAAVNAPAVGTGCAMATGASLQVGTAGVTSGDDSILLVKDTFGSFTIGARESDPVPGAPGFTYTSGPWRPAVGPDGHFAFSASATSVLGPSTIVVGPDGAGGFEALIWEGQPAPGIPGAEIAGGDGAPVVNGLGEVAFNGLLTVGVGGVTIDTDEVHWGPDADGLPEPRLRSGDLVPGPQGPVMVESIGLNAGLNDAGETLVSGTLVVGIGGVLPGAQTAWFLTRRGGDARILARRGDLVEVDPGDVRELLNVYAQCCNPEPDGGVVFLATFTDGSRAILRARLVDVVPTMQAPLTGLVASLLLASGAGLAVRPRSSRA